jgi:ABC-2 type transport system ATP-binding protein
MRDLLKKLADDGRTILVSSHLLSEMQLLADDVVIIAAGKLVTHGPVAQVLEGTAQLGQVRVRTPHIERLTAELATLSEQSEEKASVQPGPDGALLVTGVTAPVVGAAALRAGAELHELVTEKPDLERVFLELTAGKADIR